MASLTFWIESQRIRCIPRVNSSCEYSHIAAVASRKGQCVSRQARAGFFEEGQLKRRLAAG